MSHAQSPLEMCARGRFVRRGARSNVWRVTTFHCLSSVGHNRRENVRSESRMVSLLRKSYGSYIHDISYHTNTTDAPPNKSHTTHISSETGLKQTWEVGRFSMITRRYVGKREEKNHYGI